MRFLLHELNHQYIPSSNNVEYLVDIWIFSRGLSKKCTVLIKVFQCSRINHLLLIKLQLIFYYTHLPHMIFYTNVSLYTPPFTWNNILFLPRLQSSIFNSTFRDAFPGPLLLCYFYNVYLLPYIYACPDTLNTSLRYQLLTLIFSIILFMFKFSVSIPVPGTK